MGDLFGAFGTRDKNVTVEKVDRVEDTATMRLREEKLNVAKHSVRTGEVILHKDIVEETQTVVVPVTREEVVVERRVISATPSDEPIGKEEIIRIPVSEERVDVDKSTIVTGEVALRKRVVEETEEITDTVRKERAHVEVEGKPDVIDEGAYTELR